MSVKAGASGSQSSSATKSQSTPFAGTPLSQNYSDLLSQIAPNIIRQLSGNQGNAFPGAASTQSSATPGGLDLGASIQKLLAELGNPNSFTQQAGAGLADFHMPTLDNSPINPQDTEYYKSLTGVLNNQNMQNVADLRARFGGTGTSRGTPAAVAEALYNANAIPQLGATLGAARQGEFGNLLGERSLAQSGQLGLAGMDLSRLGQLGQLGQNQTGLDSNNLNSLLSSFQNLRGQDIGNNQFNAGQGNDMSKFNSGLNFQGNTDQLNRMFQGLLALFGGGLDLSKLGFGTSNYGKQTSTDYTGGFGFSGGK